MEMLVRFRLHLLGQRGYVAVNKTISKDRQICISGRIRLICTCKFAFETVYESVLTNECSLTAVAMYANVDLTEALFFWIT